MPDKNILLEACVDSVESALAAQEGGADRIELCADLLEGGITPSAATIALASKFVTLPIMVMIRPRGGDFLYSDLEFEEMKLDIEFVKQFDVAGVVLGLLDEEGAVDKKRTKILVDTARPLKVTFHRAFDMARDPFEALEDLIELGIDRVLTSGQKPSVTEGIEVLKKLVARAAGKIEIMPGGGVNEENAGKIIKLSGAKEIHASAREKKESIMKFRNSETSMSDNENLPEYEIMVTSSKRIRAIKESIK